MAQGALQVGITSLRLSEKIAEFGEIAGSTVVTLSTRAAGGIAPRIIGKNKISCKLAKITHLTNF